MKIIFLATEIFFLGHKGNSFKKIYKYKNIAFFPLNLGDVVDGR